MEDSLYSLLDPSPEYSNPRVDIGQLRQAAVHGIPDHPPHLRPLIYSLLLGVIPLDKRQWKQSIKNQKSHYYGLVRTHMEALEDLPDPTTGSISQDNILLSISRDVIAAQRRFPLLKYPLTRSKTSPLAPSSRSTTHVQYIDDSESAASSSEDETGSSESSKSEGRLPKELRCRRAMFHRLEKIAKGQEEAESSRRNLSNETATDDDTQRNNSALSPQIILSSDETGQYESSPSISLTLENSVADPSQDGRDKRPLLPITLLQSKPIAPPKSEFATRCVPLPDTHAEAVCRILFVFVSSNPQWKYHQNLTAIISQLYITYLQITWSTRLHRKQRYRFPMVGNKSAEEQTYWSFCALVREFEPLLLGNSDGPLSIENALECLDRRVKWADEPLWTILSDNALAPGSPTFSTDWMINLLTNLPDVAVPLAWDFIMASRSSPAAYTDAFDSVIDICAAAVLVSRPVLLGPQSRVDTAMPSQSARSILWGTTSVEAGTSSHDPSKMLRILRQLPLDRDSSRALLHIANNLRDSRLEEGVQDLNLTKPASTPASSSLMNLGQSARALSPYITDSVASVSQTSARWASAAYQSLTSNSASSLPVHNPVPNPQSQGTARSYSRLFNNVRFWSASAASTSHPVQPAPIDQHTVATPIPHDESAQSAFSVLGLQEKIAEVGKTFGSPKTPPPKRASLQGPRPLLLSSSARRVSARRDSQESSSGAISPPTDALSSPAPIHTNLTPTTNLYRIGTRQGQHRRISVEE